MILGACASSGPKRSTAAFCGQLSNSQVALTHSTNSADVQTTVAAYQAADAVAPEAIRDEWHEMTGLVVKAATAQLATRDQVAVLTTGALGSEAAARRVREYVAGTCGLDLFGPATTAGATATAPGETAAATTTGP